MGEKGEPASNRTFCKRGKTHLELETRSELLRWGGKISTLSSSYRSFFLLFLICYEEPFCRGFGRFDQILW